MGGGMSKILPGLYVGNFRDAKHVEQLRDNNITHILSIHDNAKKILDDKKYLIIQANDSPYEDLIKHFPECIEFIHNARVSGGAVLVHCLAGVSRSVTITAAYIMTVTSLNWRESLNAIRGARTNANPNFGFQKQLQTYETDKLDKARKKFKARFPENQFNDEADCRQLLQCFKHYVQTGQPLPNSAANNSSASRPKDEHDGLYPLPPNAYSSKRQSKLDPDLATTSSLEPDCQAESESAASHSDGTGNPEGVETSEGTENSEIVEISEGAKGLTVESDTVE